MGLFVWTWVIALGQGMNRNYRELMAIAVISGRMETNLDWLSDQLTRSLKQMSGVRIPPYTCSSSLASDRPLNRAPICNELIIGLLGIPWTKKKNLVMYYKIELREKKKRMINFDSQLKKKT